MNESGKFHLMMVGGKMVPVYRQKYGVEYILESKTFSLSIMVYLN